MTAAATSSTTLKAPPSRATADVHSQLRAPAVEEKAEAPKLDRFHARGVGAPSPDYSGMLDDDGAPDVDPATQIPTVPVRGLQKVRA